MLSLLWMLLDALGLILVVMPLLLSVMLAKPLRMTPGRAMGADLPTEPADVELEGHEVTFQLTKNVSTPGWLLKGHQHDGPVVLMQHGFIESRFASLSRAAIYANDASQVVVYDMRGHGESSASACYGGTVEVDDVFKIIEQLDEMIGQPYDLVLYGFSMGSGVSVVSASRWLGSGQARLVGVIAEGIYQHWKRPLARFLWYHRLPPWPFVRLIGWINYLFNPGLRDFDRVAAAKNVNVPLLLLHGQQDWLCPVEDARAVAQAAPHAKLIEFERAQHMDVAQIEPERYRGELTKWFGDLSQTTVNSTSHQGDSHDRPD